MKKAILLSVIFGLSILLSVPKARAFDFGSISAKDLISNNLPEIGIVTGLAAILYGIYNYRNRHQVIHNYSLIYSARRTDYINGPSGLPKSTQLSGSIGITNINGLNSKLLIGAGLALTLGSITSAIKKKHRLKI